MSDHLLPSWRPGPTRDRVVGFLDAIADVPVSDRVAVFDNDGTLWCERPTYAQYDFFEDRLRTAAAAQPELADRPEYRVVLDGDQHGMAELGLARVAFALAELFEGQTPEDYQRSVTEFFSRAVHRSTGRPLSTMTYQPMLELLDELRRRDVDVFIVSGGGVEFVRAVSEALYDVTPDRVVGSSIRYRYERRGDTPTLVRTAELDGPPNEGPAKVDALQRHLGRRPLLAAGNSLGDREMLELAHAASPSLALLIDHDDAEREFAYASEAGTMDDLEPITELGRREGWTIVSMRDDWSTVFTDAP